MTKPVSFYLIFFDRCLIDRDQHAMAFWALRTHIARSDSFPANLNAVWRSLDEAFVVSFVLEPIVF
ncbi:hypothetical protein [Luteibacter sp. UNCMF366Tsu5.1]|uniref:hypothetical protein n=1 Tax=Luteibacter sp. UNCMF366Tsu5.1 TaxID=1502758 RepID=UPI0011601060|nr:hypothetical protein [Luteibacter sp. UNCMF366Tsu5.1]